MSLLPSWGFRNTVHTSKCNKSVDLPLQNAAEGDGTATIPFSELLDKFVPEVSEGYRFNLKPYLFNGALQTLYVANSNWSKCYQVWYARNLIKVSEEDAKVYKNMPWGQFTADYVVKPKEKTKEEFEIAYKETLPEGYPRLHPRCRYYTKDEFAEIYKEWDQDDKPIVLVFPGLAGGINEPQIRAACESLFNAGNHVIVVNARGCCRSPITTPYLYHALATDDMRWFIQKLQKRFPNKQVHLQGYSFGGVLIANYLAEEGDKSTITSAVSISSPWDLWDASTAIMSTYIGRSTLQPAIVFFLTRLVENNKKVLATAGKEHFDLENFEAIKKNIKTSEEFDNACTARLAGFPSGSAYYTAGSPLTRIFKIKTPFLIINSKDDPMISTHYPALDCQQSPYLYMATCDFGGHYAFITDKGKFWYADLVTKYVETFYKNIDGKGKRDDHGYNMVQEHYQDIITLY